MDGYNTNLAAEFHVLSVLHRLGMDATLTLGNKKSVDIVVMRDVDDLITIDVKGLAGTSSWPIDNLKEGKRKHFIVFVTFKGFIGNPAVCPEVYVVPSEEIASIAYSNPGGTRRVLPLHRARKEWARFENAWDLIRGKSTQS